MAEVAIARLKCEIAVIAVFAFLKIQCLPRYNMKQIAVLLKKGTAEIKRSSVTCGIPRVSPPAAALVHREGCALGIHRKHGFLAGIAGAMMQIPLIAPCHFSLQSAATAESRQRERSDGKRLADFFMQAFFIGRNGVRLTALCANLPCGELH